MIKTGIDAQGRITEPDNFAAVIGHANVGRYPFGIALSADDRTLFVTHVGVFQYTHLRPANPTGNDNLDYPLCYPGAGYPDETRHDRVIEISKVDPRNLPDSLRDPDGIRCGYVAGRPALHRPRSRQSQRAAVVVCLRARRQQARSRPERREIVKTGPLVGRA